MLSAQLVENRRVERHVAPLKRRPGPSQPLTSKNAGLLWERALGPSVGRIHATRCIKHDSVGDDTGAGSIGVFEVSWVAKTNRFDR